jgi:hypothetical protein
MQQPPDPYSQFQQPYNAPTSPYEQQPPTPGQFQYPSPYNYNSPPKPPSGFRHWLRTRSRNTKIGLGCGTLIGALLICICAASAYGSSTVATTLTPTPTTGHVTILNPPTVNTTTASSSQQSSQIATQTTSTILERPVIGSTEPTFVNAFGKPTSHETYSSGSTGETFATRNRMIDTFAISLEPGTEPGINLVYGIYISAPAGRLWDIAAGIALRNSYLPSDTVMGKPRIITEAGGVQMYYREGNSAALAATVDPSYFFDGGNHQPVKPGTINASYSYADTQGFTISMCSLLFGTSADVYQS